MDLTASRSKEDMVEYAICTVYALVSSIIMCVPQASFCTWLTVEQVQTAQIAAHCSSIPKKVDWRYIGYLIRSTAALVVHHAASCVGQIMEGRHSPLFIRSCSDGRKFSRSARRDHMVDELCKEGLHMWAGSLTHSVLQGPSTYI